MTIKKLAYASTMVGLSSLLCLGSLASSAFAQPTETRQAKSQQTGGETLRQGLPGRRLGGGTREGGQVFVDGYSYLAALMTSDNLGVTTAERPTLMFYIPPMVSEQPGELVIRDEADNVVYKSTFPVYSEGGILSFNTAEDEAMPALAMDETYQWNFSIMPDVVEQTSDIRANDIAVSGNIRRVERESWLTEQSGDSATVAALGETSPLAQARMLYQQTNLWHDAAIIIDELRQANPADAAIAAEWNQLIEFAGLSAIVETPESTIQIGLN